MLKLRVGKDLNGHAGKIKGAVDMSGSASTCKGRQIVVLGQWISRRGIP